MNRGGLSLPTDGVSDVAPQGLGAAGVPDSRVPGTVFERLYPVVAVPAVMPETVA
jgi:hypothetical protein